jgi:hypothetical protein
VDLESGPPSCPFSWTSAQRDCTERASVFPPRKAAAPLTAPFERLASKGPAETATIQPPTAQPPLSPEGVRITAKITRLPPRDFDLRKRPIGNSGAFFCYPASSAFGISDALVMQTHFTMLTSVRSKLCSSPNPD